MRIRWVVAAILALGFAGSVRAAEAAPAANVPDSAPNIAQMSTAELRTFVDQVGASLRQESLDLDDEVKAKDCLKLTESANAFTLAYSYLGLAFAEAEKRMDQPAMVVRYRALQSRVVGFAARVRSADWLLRLCASFTPPAELASDRRYRPVPRLAVPEFSRAAVELRQVAEANLALAELALKGKDCGTASGAADGIDIFIPYLDAMSADLKARPEAIGPVASPRGLEQTRTRLVTALRNLDATFAPLCSKRAPQ